MKKVKLVALTTMVAGIFSCGGSQTSAPEITEETTVATETVASKVATGSYDINTTESIINWEGKKIIGESHTGTLAIASGSIDVAEGMIIAGKFDVDMTSMKNTDLPDDKKAKLVGHLSNGDFFEVDKFPNASFEITTATADKISGNLTIKGKTEATSFPYTLSSEEGKLVANATLEFDRTKFGVTYGSGNYFADLAKDRIIEDNISLAIKLIATAH